jgi:glycosyltransferase involved in cell wall biosynthesis
MKLLISAFSCAPSLGSEQAVGWNWATEAHRLGHQVCVLVCPAHRDAIAAGVREDAALKEMQWAFPELPYWPVEQGKEPKRSRTYNLLWQRAALRAARELHRKIGFDIVHHLTWAGIRAPTYLGSLGPPLIIGPVGGGETSPATLRDGFPLSRRILEAVRDLSNSLINVDPLVHSGIKKASVIFCTTPDTRNLFNTAIREKAVVYTQLGIHATQLRTPRVPRQTPPRMLFAGRLYYWKGVHIAIQALAEVLARLPTARLTIVGNGPEEARLKADALAYKVNDSVDFIPRLPQSKLFDLFESHHLLIFPSLHDSGGFVVVEALSHGMPVMCLDLGGPKEIVTPNSGVIVKTDGLNTAELASRMADEICNLFASQTRLAELSAGAIARAREFLFPERVAQFYREAWKFIEERGAARPARGGCASKKAKLRASIVPNQPRETLMPNNSHNSRLEPINSRLDGQNSRVEPQGELAGKGLFRHRFFAAGRRFFGQNRKNSRMSRPRILLVGPMPPTKGGITTFMLNLMSSYLNEQFEFVPYTTTRPPKRDVIDNWGYAAVLRGGPVRMLQGILLTIGRFIAFPYVVISRRIDLVQIHASDYQVFCEGVVYAILARAVGRPAVLRLGGSFDLFHGGSPPVIQRWIAAALRIPQCIIAQSQYAQDYLRRAGRTGEIIVLPNWIRDPNLTPKTTADPSHPICLFIASNEARRKGIEEVIEAMRQLDAAGSPARFHLVAMTPSLVERVNALHLNNIRAVEGPAEHSRVLELMRRADVFLLPSHGEGFPNSLVEAMAAGMACVVTPVGAVPEMVADGGALVIPVGDAAALRSAIERLAADPQLRRRLGEEAQRTIRARYTPSSALPPLSDAYSRLLLDRRHGQRLAQPGT